MSEDPTVAQPSVDEPVVDQPGVAEPRFPDTLRLAAAIVICADGRRAGRVRDVYVDDDTGILAAVSVVVGRLRQREVLVPVLALAAEEPDTDEVLRLRVGRDVLREGAAPPHTGHVTNAGLRDAAAALGLDPERVTLPVGPGGKRSLTQAEMRRQRERAAVAEQPEGSVRSHSRTQG